MTENEYQQYVNYIQTMYPKIHIQTINVINDNRRLYPADMLD